MAYDEDKDFDDKDNVSEDIILSSSSAIETDITPRDLMGFAKWILFVLALLFMLGGLCEYFEPDSNIFEACKTILPPIATLVIGYYFGKSS